MFHGSVNTFALIINFLNETWMPIHIIVGLFEANKTIEESMVIQLWYLLKRFGLLHWIILFVKDKGINLTTMATILHSIIGCEHLKIFKVFKSTCFAHVMSKWKSFKVYHTWQKRPSPYCNPFLLYILIPIKNNESKVVKKFRRTIF